MADITNWREAAAEELRDKLNTELALADNFSAQERTARAGREDAEKRAAHLVIAAGAFGISLGIDAPERHARRETAEGVLTTRDIILDALRAAHPKPMKAAELRKTIETRLGRAIHFKTAGMSLNRLLNDGDVRREGHRWYAVTGDQQREEQQEREEPIRQFDL